MGPTAGFLCNCLHNFTAQMMYPQSQTPTVDKRVLGTSSPSVSPLRKFTQYLSRSHWFPMTISTPEQSLAEVVIGLGIVGFCLATRGGAAMK